MADTEKNKTPLPDIIMDSIPDLPAVTETAEIAQPAPRPRKNPFARFKTADPSQKKAGANLIKFFALVLVFTLVSRGTRAAAMPVVSTTRADKGEIIDKIALTGYVNTAREQEIILPEGLTISEVLAGTGQKLEKGGLLFRLDSAEVDELIKREENTLKELELKQKQAQRGESYDGTALAGAQAAADRAQQDYARQEEDSAHAIARAEAALSEAGAELGRLRAIIENPDADEDEKAEAEAQLAAAESAYKNASAAADDARRQAEASRTAAQRQIEDANRSLDSAAKNDSEARQSLADKNAQDKLTAEGLALDIAKQQKKLDELYEIRDNSYTVTAPAEGQVTNLPQEGEKTSAAPAATIALSGHGFTATADVEEKKAERLNVGDSCDIALNTGSMFGGRVEQGTIKSISRPDANGNVSVEITLPEGNWKSGQTVDIQFILSKESHPQTIPIAALRSDNNGYYVLVTQQEVTVLGTENILYKIPVNVKVKDEKSAAIEGAIGMNEEIVLSANKPVQENDRVRTS